MIQKILFILLVTCGLNHSVQGQTVPVPDVNFRNYLSTLSPSVLDGSSNLIIANAQNYTGSLSFQGLNITNVEGIQYFHSVELINCSNNQITQIPDLDNLANLRLFWCFNNQLTSLPSIQNSLNLEVLDCKDNLLTSLPDLSGFSRLRSLQISNNPISTLSNLNNLDSLREFRCLNNQLSALPLLPHSLKLEILDCKRNSLTALPDLSAYINLRYLDCAHNQLTTLPDLSENQELRYLYCYSNQLSSLPILDSLYKLKVINCQTNNLATLPPLANNDSLELLNCAGNLISSLPDISGNTALKELYVHKNELYSLPDLSTHSNLTAVRIDSNRLTFEDLIPITSLSVFPSTIFSPQKEQTVASLQPPVDQKPYTIDLGFDSGVAQSIYYWFKNGSAVDTTTIPQLYFNKLSYADSGSYSLQVVNGQTEFSSCTLSVQPFNLAVLPCFTIDHLHATVSNASCTEGMTVDLSSSFFNGAATPVLFRFRNTTSGEWTNVSVNGILDNILPGLYDVSITDQEGCTDTVSAGVNLPYPDNCGATFTPNGDGVEDEFYIDAAGRTRIFTKEGKLVRELNTPGYWDGKDMNNNLVDMGYYVIVTDEKIMKGVVLIR